MGTFFHYNVDLGWFNFPGVGIVVQAVPTGTSIIRLCVLPQK